jgi:hypothetical protein
VSSKLFPHGNADFSYLVKYIEDRQADRRVRSLGSVRTWACVWRTQLKEIICNGHVTVRKDAFTDSDLQPAAPEDILGGTRKQLHTFEKKIHDND